MASTLRALRRAAAELAAAVLLSGARLVRRLAGATLPVLREASFFGARRAFDAGAWVDADFLPRARLVRGDAGAALPVLRAALLRDLDVARDAGAGVDARRPAGGSVRGLVMVFSIFFAGEARHRDVDDEGGRPVGRAVPAHAKLIFLEWRRLSARGIDVGLPVTILKGPSSSSTGSNSGRSSK